ncbi:MAG: DUF4157 domain-containing protein [Ferruginibacter sp.]|nr:DUF4157 domain-containing protein [Ferruginibacter sp.]
MKTAEAKPATAQAQKSAQPFFNKAGGALLSKKPSDGQGAFFSSRQNNFFNNNAIQPKLTIGQPNDKYEQEADHIADKVVQRLSKIEKAPSAFETVTPLKTVQAKPLVPVANITPLIQTKCASCGQEEKLQKKEGEQEPDVTHDKLQKKPIFESNSKPPDEDNRIQRKCADCEKGHKLQKRKNNIDAVFAKPAVQLKPIFESNAAPEERLQRKCASCEQEEHLQKQENNGGAQSAGPSVESSLSASKGGGSPLPESTRTQMESSIGADFSGVRIHNNSNAAQLSDNLNAQAFTHGNDIYFNSGKYDTCSNEGKHLLAHELTHTVQQGGGLKRKEFIGTNTDIQKATAAPKLTPVSSEVVNISSGQFAPSENVKAEIEQAGENGLDVRVIVPKISREGKIKVKRDHQGNFNAVNGQTGYMPITNVWADKIGGLYLVFQLKNNIITNGIVSTKMKGPNIRDWLNALKAKSELLGAVGLKIGNLPTPVNEFAGDTYKIGVNDLHVEVGGFIDAKVNFVLENSIAPKIDASADINVKGLAKGQLIVDNTKGPLTGEVSLSIDYKDFTGNATVRLKEDGSIDIRGKAGYNANKLSGEVAFVSTDAEAAKTFATDAIKAAGGVKNAKEITEVPMLPAPREGSKQRALAATGQLQFTITDWFAGTVNVIVDGEGHVTVIGKIAPPAEVELFKQKNYDKEIFSLQVEAGYGIPVIGTIGIFAGVILSAVAYIGPAKLCNIEIEGTYSTDPTIQKSIQISASLNISAYAGLRLRAEGGAKLTVLSHDLKIGVGVNADVGVKAYADARATIGYRDPGVFYISGTAELVAQPMLGLSGDFFIDLKTPWWSPLSDDRWIWPIGSKEWPLSDPIGLSATMNDYVLGSGVVPDIEFKKPEFDPSKFMTNMVDKTLPDKSGAGKEGKAGFKDNQMPPPPVPDAKPKKGEKAEGPKTAKGITPKGLPAKKPTPDPKAQQDAIELFKRAAPKFTAIKKPITKGDLKKELDKIELEVKGIKYSIALSGNQWVVTSSAKEVNNPKPVNFTAIVTDEDKKEGKDGKKDDINNALAEIDIEAKRDINDGVITDKEANAIKNKVNADYGSVIKISSVKDGGETWDFEYVQAAIKKEAKGNKISKYAEYNKEGKLVLKPEYAITVPSKGTIVRNRFYGTSYRKSVRDMKNERLTTKRGLKTKSGYNGLRHPTDSMKYWHGDQYWENKGNTKATIEHKYKVVEHWVDTGRKTQQPVRLDFYNDISHMDIQPSSKNKSEGSEAEVGYRTDVTKDFRGPKENL